VGEHEAERPLRADAARNRARVLEVAYETFAAKGLAGVGAGTVYRHVPTKEALFAAVFEDRIRRIGDNARALLASEGPRDALFVFLRDMVRNGATDYGLVDALAGYGIDLETAAPGAEAEFLAVLGELLTAAQRAGSVRADVGVREIKALLLVCKTAQLYGDDVSERVVDVVEDGLRAS
jgi:AcrR family transcriptional regulator